MTRGRVTTHESEAVGVNKLRLTQRDAATFRVGDTLIDRKCRRLTSLCDLYRLLDRQVPWEVQLQIGEFAREQIRIGQACAVICGSVSGNGEGCRHGIPYRLRGEV